MTYFDTLCDRDFRNWEESDATNDPANAQPCPTCGPYADQGENSLYPNPESLGWRCILCGHEEE